MKAKRVEEKEKSPPGRHTKAGENTEHKKDSTTRPKAQAVETPVRTAVSHLDDQVVVELAWNVTAGACDFIVFDRQSKTVRRSTYVDLDHSRLVPPSEVAGVVTPGLGVRGSVFVPAEASITDDGTPKLRQDVRQFIEKYVELPAGTIDLVTEYVFMSWVHDSFDELPYMAFRTARSGSGKSRALETTGKICFRPLFCGGGSSAPAIFRLIDSFGGTLVIDEFDHDKRTELTAMLTKILNQGFQRDRPLLRCVGDKFTPTPFNVFGPKLFVLRHGFHDDATESRTISIRMRHRTRKDIPINLPRAEFDREALNLRNRLLMYRFQNVGKVRINEKWNVEGLEDRYNQIASPLFAVAESERVRRQIGDALRTQQADLAADRSQGLAGEVFAAVVALSDSEGVIRPGSVADYVNRRRAKDDGVDVGWLGYRRIDARKVANILSKVLELPREGKDVDGAYYGLPADRDEELRNRFGLRSEQRHERQDRQSRPKPRNGRHKKRGDPG